MIAAAQTKTAHICIITPSHLSHNPRVLKEADALQGAGYDVSLVIGDYSMWARQQDKAFEDRPWRVQRKLSFGPIAPVGTRIAQVLVRNGARALFSLGLRNPQTATAAWHYVSPNLVEAAARIRADLYIAHYPAALPAAAVAASRFGAAYAFDAEDFHLGDLPDLPKHDAERLILRTLEAHYLPGCAFITADSPGTAEGYAEAYRIAIPNVVLNVFPIAQAPTGPTAAGTSEPRPSIYWFSRTLGPNRGIECAIRAIALTTAKPHLYLRGDPAKGYLEHLQRVAAESGTLERVHFLPLAPSQEMERLASRYDVGFSGEPGHTRNNQQSHGNKLFSFLLAGVPIVASDIPAHVRLLPVFGDAMRLFRREDAGDLAIAIDSLVGNPDVLAAARTAAFRLGQSRFNWENEQLALIACVRRVLAERQRPTTSRPGVPERFF